MNKIGIIGAMEEEIALLKEKIILEKTDTIAGMIFYQGRMYDKEVVIVKSGIGKVNAAICTQIMIDRFCVQAIINTGVAGAIDSKLDIGDIVISSDSIQHDVDATGFGYKLGEIPRMDTWIFKADDELINLAKTASEYISNEIKVYINRVVSGDQFISDNEKKEYIYNNFQGYCTEMEGAAIAHVCYLNNIPYVVIRSISDKADHSAEVNFAEFVDKATKHSSQMIDYMIKKLN